MSSMGQSYPFQNRQSLISCWNHEMAAEDDTGDEVTDLGALLSADGVFLRDLPFCIPRSSRLKEICLLFDSVDAAAGYPQAITMQVLRNRVCDNVTWLTRKTEIIAIGGSGFQCHCFDDDDRNVYEKCDLWRIDFDLLPDGEGFFFPQLRIVTTFELR